MRYVKKMEKEIIVVTHATSKFLTFQKIADVIDILE
jgi:hypothetical protein